MELWKRMERTHKWYLCKRNQKSFVKEEKNTLKQKKWLWLQLHYTVRLAQFL